MYKNTSFRYRGFSLLGFSKVYANKDDRIPG